MRLTITIDTPDLTDEQGKSLVEILTDAVRTEQLRLPVKMEVVDSDSGSEFDRRLIKRHGIDRIGDSEPNFTRLLTTDEVDREVIQTALSCYRHYLNWDIEVMGEGSREADHSQEWLDRTKELEERVRKLNGDL